MKEYTFIIDENITGKRLDVFLTEQLTELSRTQAQRLIEEEGVLVNGRKEKAKFRLKNSDVVSCRIPDPEPLEVSPEYIALDIYYEDGDLLVINKPQGMVVHPAHGNYQGTLVNALLHHCQDLSGINGVMRPGIVHRIDKDTSGLLMVAKNDLTHQSLARQLKEHSIKREYLALVHGKIKEPGGIIDAPIGRDPKDRKKMAVVTRNSKDAITHYHVLERFQNYTLLECRLKTGRTHQIRVHMAYLNHPVVGDPKYGPKKSHLGFTGQALHAQTLGFMHPRLEEWMEFSAPPPSHFSKALQKLKSEMNFTRGEDNSEDA